jgi:hypothetical protein
MTYRQILSILLLGEGACTHAAPTTIQDEQPPPPPAIADAMIRRIDSRDDVPLHGMRVDAKKGDWLLQNLGSVAVVSASKGAIIDFGADGGDDALVSVDPTVFMGLEQMTSVVESVVPVAAHAVLIRKRILSEPPLRLWSYVTFAGGALRIESVATASDQGALAATLGEVVIWGNVPTWVEGHGFVGSKGSFPGEFIAREGAGVAYAFATEAGHIVARFAEPASGFHEAARTGERVDTIPPHGASTRRIVVLAQARISLGEAVRALPRFAHAPVERWPLPRDLAAGTLVEVNHCDATSFARFLADGQGLTLPRGCWRLRLVAPGHAPGTWLAPEAIGSAPDDIARPRAGTLQWRVREKGAGVLPARILVRGMTGTPDPDWGEEPSDGASLNVIHADRDGQRAIPPGRYSVTITRGFEYSMHQADVAIVADNTAVVAAELDRVVDTRGWIAADLHVHAQPSPDSTVPLSDRVLALAAAGVEVAVATDHNAVTDYGRTIHERGLEPWLASIVGDEVTTRGVPLGHFNVFPLAAGSDPIPFDHVGPPALVSAARAAPPGDRDKVIQLNHPRMGSIGYFELLRFDLRDIPAWRERSPLIETGFDAIEVFNGDDYAKLDEVERVMRDWYALLDAGVRVTATGNSDSHKLTYHECGVPRNLVQMADDDPARFDERRFIDAVRRGRVVVSSGPVVMIDVAGRGVGESAPAGDQEIHVTVDAPPWVDVSRVEIVRRGQPLHTWTGPFAHTVRRLDARFTAALGKGDWLVAIARGETPMTFLARTGAKPLSFTNPVWIQ